MGDKYIVTLSDGQSFQFNEGEYKQNESTIFEKDKGAVVAKISDSPVDDSNIDDSSSYVISANDGNTFLLSGTEYRQNIDKVKKLKGVKVNALSRIDYWGEKLKANRAEVDSIKKQMDSLEKSLNNANKDWDITADAEDINAGKVIDAAKRSNNASQQLKDAKGRLETLLREREDNPAYKEQKEAEQRFLADADNNAGVLLGKLNNENKESAKMAERARMFGNDALVLYDVSVDKDKNPDYYRDREALIAARLFYTDALEASKAPSRYDDSNGFANFFKGAIGVAPETLSVFSFAKSAYKNMPLANAIKQIHDHEGEHANIIELITQHPEKLNYLSEAQKELIKAFVTKTTIDWSRADDLSLGYQSGSTAMKSLGFMADFFLMGGSGDVVAQGASRGITKAMAKAAVDAGLVGIKADIVQAVPKFALGTFKAGVKTVVMTPFMASSYANLMDDLYRVNDAGEVNLSGEAIVDAIGDVFIENLSESAGQQVEAMLGLPFKMAGKSGVGKLFANTKWSAWGKAVKNSPMAHIMKQAGWNGYIGEIGEEWYGNALRVMTGVDKDALKDFATAEQQIITLTSFAPMSIFGGAMSSAQYIVSKKQMASAGETLATILKQNGYDDKTIQNYLDITKAENPTELAKQLAPVLVQAAKDNGDVSDVYKAVMDYAQAVAQYRTYDGINDADIEQQRKDMQDAISLQTGESWIIDKPVELSDGTSTSLQSVRTITDADGNEMFATSDADESGLIAVIDRKDGHKHFVNINDEGISDSGNISLNDFLDQELVRKKDTADREQMAAEYANNSSELLAKAQPGTEVNIGTVESPIKGTILQIDNGVFLVESAEGGVKQFTEEEMANMLNMPLIPETQEQKDNAEAEVLLHQEELRERANKLIGRNIALALGLEGDIKLVMVHGALQTDEGVRYQVDYNNDGVKTEFLSEDEIGAIISLSENKPIAEEAEENTENEVPNDNIPRDFRGNPLPMRTNKQTGQQVVDGNALWNNDPEAWARWNDTNPNARVGSKEKLEFAISELTKDIAKDTKAVQVAALKGIDEDEIDKLEDALGAKVRRREQLTNVLDKYNLPVAAGQTIAGEQRKSQAEQTIQEQQAGFPGIQQKWANAPKISGAEDEIRLPNGETIEGRYILVEADKPTPSHNPSNGFAMTEGFPVDENGKTVNDRDYEHDQAAQASVMDKAANYDQRALQTPVIVSSDGVVLSGNDRTMASQIAAANNTDGAYLNYLSKYAQKFGFTAEQVKQFKHPRVVFETRGDMPYNAATFAKFNAEEKKSQSKTEKAVKAGKTITPEVLGSLATLVDRYDDINALYNDAAGVDELLNIFLRAEVISQEQVAALKDGERLSGTGMDMLESTLIGAALDEEAVRIAMSDSAIRKSVVSAISQIILGNTLANYNLRAELTDAITLVASGKAAKEIKFGESVQSYVRQQHLFIDDVVAEATVQMLADAINDRKTSFLKKVLSLYNTEAADAEMGQMNLLTGDVLTREAILRNILEYFGYDTNIIFDTSEREAERRAASEQAADGAEQADQTEQNDAPVQSDAGSTVSNFNREEVAAILEQGNVGETGLADYMSDEEVAEFMRLWDAFLPYNDALGEAYNRLSDDLRATADKKRHKAAQEEIHKLELAQVEAFAPVQEYVDSLLAKYELNVEEPATAENEAPEVVDTLSEEVEDEFTEDEFEDEELQDEEPKPKKGKKASKKGKKEETKPLFTGKHSDEELASVEYTTDDVEELIFGASLFGDYTSKKTGEKIEIVFADDEHPVYNDHQIRFWIWQKGAEYGDKLEAVVTTDQMIRYLKLNGFKLSNPSAKKNQYGYWVNEHGVIINPIRIELPSVRKGWAQMNYAGIAQRNDGKWVIAESFHGGAKGGYGSPAINDGKIVFSSKSEAIRAIIANAEKYIKTFKEGKSKSFEYRDIENLIRTLKTKTLPQALMEEGVMNNVPRAEINNEDVNNGVQGLLFGEEGETFAPAAEEKPKRKRTSKKKAETPAASVEETPVEDSEDEEAKQKYVLEDEEGTPGNFHWVSESVCTNPIIIAAPGLDKKDSVSKIALAEKDGKWYVASYVVEDSGKGTSFGSVIPSFKGNFVPYSSRYAAIKAAIGSMRWLLDNPAKKSQTAYGETFNETKALIDYLVKMELPASQQEDNRIEEITERLKEFDNAKERSKAKYYARIMKSVGQMLDFADDELNTALKSAAERFRSEQLSDGVDRAQERYVRRVRQALKDATGNTTMLGYGNEEAKKDFVDEHIIIGGVPSPQKSAEKPAAPSYGSQNKLVTTDQYEELKKKMLTKLNSQLNAGFDPEILAWGAQMAMYHVEAGARKFIDFSQRMIRDLGDGIRPYLQAIYNGARYMPGMEELRKDMDSAADVEAINVDSISIEEPTAEETPVPEESTELPPVQGWEERMRGGVDGADVQGFDFMSEYDILANCDEHIDELQREGLNIAVVDMRVIGSRAFGMAREDSDLDVLVEYEGDMKEDEVFNALNAEPFELLGIKVDFFPIRSQESGTLTEWLESHNNGRPVEKEQPKVQVRDEDKIFPTLDSWVEDAKENFPAVMSAENVAGLVKLINEVKGYNQNNTKQGNRILIFGKMRINFPRQKFSFWKYFNLLEGGRQTSQNGGQNENVSSLYYFDEPTNTLYGLDYVKDNHSSNSYLRSYTEFYNEPISQPETPAAPVATVKQVNVEGLLGAVSDMYAGKRSEVKLSDFAAPVQEETPVEAEQPASNGYSYEDVDGIIYGDTYTHTKTGETLYRVSIGKDVRLTDEEFKEAKRFAKLMFNGYYSSFAKGFLFESESEANNFINGLKGLETIQNYEKGNYKTDEQTATDTAIISSQAASVASEAQSLAESTEPADERTVNRTIQRIDDTLDKIDDQLALLGYYEADQTGPFHESYGYMKSAEKKAVKDADRLAKKLAAVLGIEVGRKTLAKANIAPAGGEVSFRLPLNDGHELYMCINLMPKGYKPGYGYEDDLVVRGALGGGSLAIYFRVENPNATGQARYVTPNNNQPYNVSYADLLKAIRRDARNYLPEATAKTTATSGPVDILQVAKEQAEKSRKSNKKSVSSQEDGDAMLGGLFADLYDAEEDNAPEEESQKPAERVKPTEINGFTKGEKVLYTPSQGNRTPQEATIYDFEYDGRPVLDAGLAPVLYEVVEWEQIQKIESEPVNNADNGLQGNDELRAEGLSADNSGQQQGVQRGAGEESKEPGQESGRTNRGGEGGREGDVHGRTRTLRPRYDDSVKRNTRNYRRAKGDDVPKTIAARYKANIAAIRLLKELQDSGKQATKEQMSVLRQYTGWGGLGGYFNNEYSPEYRELRSLLTDEELQAAALSINTAYYTPTEIIESMWDIAKRLGFEGGNVLEGSAGIGNILASMPKSISERSAITAVELDNITGGILQQLYPDANVQIKGFQEVDIPNGSVDLAITNVPFGDINVYDSKEKDLTRKFGGKIHDFCIAKNVRKLAEGGIGIFISTRGTLDNSSKALRQWIVNEGGADVIGAFRLNNDTFEGTKATSDIIVIRKRVNGQVSPNAIDVTNTDITRREKYTTNDTEWNKTTRSWEPVTGNAVMEMNTYFVEHPENMGGVMGFGFEHNDTYRPGSSALWPSEKINQNNRLAKWVKQFSDMQEEVAPTVSETESVAEEANATKEGQLVTNSKGEICISRSGKAIPLGLNSQKVKGYSKTQVLTDYNALKTAINELLDFQLANESDEGLKPLLDNLNRAYDRFAKRYDRLNRNTAISFLRNDVDFPSIAAVEDYKEKKAIDGKVKIEVKKTSIFSGRVLGAKRIPTPSNAKDGVIISINQFGRIDIPFIANALNKDDETVRKEILSSGLGFENPQTGNVEVEYEYLSGNVREKLEYARTHNTDGQYDKNIEALEKVIPADIPAHLIEFSLGSDWMPVELYTQYAKEKFGVNDNFVPTMVGGSWLLPENTWEMNLNTEQNRAAGVHSEKLRTDKNGHELMIAAMNNTSVVFSRTYKDYQTGETITEHDKEATQAATTKMSEMRDDFKEWCRAKMLDNTELAERIAKIYNDTFNAIVPKEIRDTFIPKHFEGMATKLNNGKPLNLRLHQAKAVIRATTEPLMMAHEVGTGKTFTLITTAMEMRRLGTAKKPMIVVQNATLGQFVSSAKEIYPNAKILTISEADRTVEGRSAFYAKIKYNDWDMIVVPQSVFEMIPDSEERQRAYIQEKIDEKKFILEQAKEAKNSTAERQLKKELEELEYEYQYGEKPPKKGKGGKNDAKKDAEAIENTVAKAKKQLDRKTDDVSDFDDMGIDALLVDEAHSYKHLGFSTAMQRGVKGVDATGSKKSAGVYLKTRAVFDKVGWKNVVFATGTPISNTAAEIWTFMKYLMPADVMRQNHIYYFDDFVRNFGSISQSLEFTTSGKFKETTRFAAYTNLPELIRIWSSVTDTVRSKDAVAEGDEKLEDKQPKMEGGQARDIYLPQSPSLVDIMNAVRAKLEWYEGLTGKEKKENSHIPLTMFGIAKMAAIDPRLVDRDALDEPNSKTNMAVEETLKALKDSERYNGTCALFCDNFRRWDYNDAGKRVEGFNIFEEVKRKLIAAGVPEGQIVIMKSGMNTAAKEKIFARVNSGEVRVIMGTTATLGTGVNIQERLFFEAHLDAPNRPMDYTQRNGRILRQGNLHKDWNIPVRVVRFGVEDSLDVTAYQRLSTKAKFIESIMDGKPLLANGMDNRVLEEEEEGEFDNPVAVLSGSQYALLKSQAERELRKLRNKKEQHRQDQIYIERTLKENKNRIAYDEKLIEQAKDNLTNAHTTFSGGNVKEITIQGRKANSVEQAAEIIKDIITTPIRSRLDSRRVERGFTNETLKYAMTFDGVAVNISVDVERTNEYDEKRHEYRAVMRTRVEYSVPRFNIEGRFVQGGYSAIKDIVPDFIGMIASGRYFEDAISRLTNTVNRLNSDNELMLQRRGKPFADEDKLAEQEKIVADYTEKMKAEMAEKEAKYAEMAKNSTSSFNLDKVSTDEDEEGDEETHYSISDENATKLDVDNSMVLAEAVSSVNRIANRLGLRVVFDNNLPEKGAYTEGADYVRINLANCESVDDAVETLLHEGVAHFGLRELLGEEGMEEFISDILAKASPSILAKIENIAEDNDWSMEYAAEEYVAELAQKNDYTKAEHSFWRELLQAIRNLISAITGRNTYISDDVIREMLVASYANLEEKALSKSNEDDFEYDLMKAVAGDVFSADPSYKVVGDWKVRVKNHIPNWGNFLDDYGDLNYNVLNITVGDRRISATRDTSAEWTKEDLEKDFGKKVVDVQIEYGTTFEDALMQIRNQIKESGADFRLAIDNDKEGVTHYRVRTKPAPKHYEVGYKAVYEGKNGKPYPIMVGMEDGVPFLEKTWLDAEVGKEAESSKTGRRKVKAGGKGTKTSGGSLAFRPGFHLGDMPYALQFNVGPKVDNPLGIKNEKGEVIKVGKYFPKNIKWARVFYAADKDWQAEADATGINKNGKFQHSLVALPHIPTDGFYRYRTNPNPATDPWIITGAMYIDKILTDEEVDELVRAAGREPQEREPIVRNRVGYPESMGAKRYAANETARKAGIEIEFLPSSQMRFEGQPLAGRWINGKMYICLEHCRDNADVVRTVLHEGVGHNGLRRLIGNENMTDFCLDMFRRLPNDARKKIADAAVNKYGGNIAESVEEYLAERAEDMDFENEGYERNFWDIILDGLRKVLAKVGINVPLSQRDIRWLLWQSFNANKQNDILNLVKRQVVANKLGFTLKQQAEKAAAVQIARNKIAEEELAPAARIYNKDVLYWMNRLHETWVDKDDAVHRLVSAIEKATGKKASTFEDVRFSLNQQSSKGLAAIEKFEREYWNPMQNAIRSLMQEKGIALKDVERYVMIKHGLERNEVFAKRDARQFYKDEHDSTVTYIKNSDKIDDITKLALIAKEDAKLDKHLKDIESGTDVKYKEFRKQDYGGLTAMYSEYDAIEPFMEGVESEEEYNARVLQARHPKFTYIDKNGVEQVDMAETEKAAMKEVADFENGFDSAIEQLWKRINAATKHTIKHQYDSNMMSREQYLRVKDMFKYYVPLRGFEDKTAEDMYEYYMSDQRNEFTAPLLKAKGRKTMAESPFGYIGSMASSGIAADMKNETKLALYYFVSNRAANDLVTISEVWYKNTGVDELGRRIFSAVYPPITEDLGSEDAKKKYEEWEKQMEDEAKAGFAFKGTRKLNLHNSVIHIDNSQAASHIIKFKVGGRDMMMYINGNPRAAQAINNELNVEMSTDYQKVFGKILRWFSGINTSYNPEFWLSNAQRDALFALMSVNVKEDSSYNEAFRRNFGKLFRDTLVPGKKGGAYSLKRRLDSGKLGDEYIDKLYQEFVENGGVTGYTTLKNNEEWELELRKYTGQEKGAMQAVRKGFEAIQRFGEAIEQMTRFAAYMTSREQGKDIKAAVNDAKELTVNFNRKGSGKAISFKEAARLRTKSGKKLTGVQKAFVVAASWLPVYGRRFIMFFNASVQGLNAMYKLYKNNPARMGTWTAAYLAFGVLQAVIHGLLDDDDDYLDIPDYERRNNLLLGKDGVYFKWALPQECRVFYGLGDMIVNHAMGRTPHKGIAGELLASMSDIAPLNPAGGIAAIAPSALTPIVEVALNRDYKGSKIYNDMRYLSDEERKRTPKYTMAYSGTGKPYILLSKFANWLSGGDYADAGWININPASVEHILQGATGGAGTTIGKLYRGTIGQVLGEDFSVRNTPFLSRILTVTDDRYRNAHTTELFDYYKAEAEHTKKLIKTYRKNEDYEKLDAIYNSEDYQIMQIYDSFKHFLKWYNDELKSTTDNTERRSLMREQDAVRKEMLKEISDIAK